MSKSLSTDPNLRRELEDNYAIYHLNRAVENKNEKVLKRYGHPDKYNFPVIITLNQEGRLIHI
ncbi:MAG: hypothetical protein ABI045_05815 [Flavobacteriales bacterium]